MTDTRGGNVSLSHPAYEALRRVTPHAAVLLQDNPGPMTLDGTNTWLLGASDTSDRIVVDPGEDSEQHAGADHLDRLCEASPDIAVVLLTHGHHDHSQAAAALNERTGVPVRALDPQYCRGAGALGDGELIDAAGLQVRVVATPGHTSDSVSFVLEGDGVDTAVLTGDTILGRGTTVVAHPDGELGPYLASLERLRGYGPARLLPGHGPELDEVGAVARQYLEHREQRLQQVRDALGALGPDATARQIVEVVYADVDQAVWWAAELSVRAQLDYLRG